jgi:hypothetical protein
VHTCTLLVALLASWVSFRGAPRDGALAIDGCGMIPVQYRDGGGGGACYGIVTLSTMLLATPACSCCALVTTLTHSTPAPHQLLNGMVIDPVTACMLRRS